ncbi:MAG TPA: HD domain-containing phosphohydrolase [Thermoleophilaceae bacterium]|nr:HD domain-containing phosphohydrolase [Thermoleophilaceae bacterium]
MRRFERDGFPEDDAPPPLPLLVDLLEERDAALHAHGARVADHAEAIGRELGLPAPAIARVRVAARLHDLGKVWIARDILEKPGPLDAREWTEIRRHPGTAARVLQTAELHDIAAIIVAHHERPDGGGYPHAVPSSETPVEAQVVAVADVYDAMTSPRPYKPMLSHDEARAELEHVAATQLDATVVGAFLRVLDGPRQPRRAAV